MVYLKFASNLGFRVLGEFALMGFEIPAFELILVVRCHDKSIYVG